MDPAALLELARNAASMPRTPWLSAPVLELAGRPIAQPVSLTTTRLTLREVELTDLDAIDPLFADAEHRRLVLPHQHGRTHVEQTLASSLVAARLARRQLYTLAIAFQGARDLAGLTYLHLHGGGHRRATIGFEIGRAASDQGVAAEAGAALVALAFTHLRVDEVIADMDERNIACQRALARIGFAPVSLRPWTKFAMGVRYRANLPYARMKLPKTDWLSRHP